MPRKDDMAEHLEKLKKLSMKEVKPVPACAQVKGRKLVLERRSTSMTPEERGEFGPIAITPPVSEEYWDYRVVLSNSQALLGFQKFTTIGIGFAVEEDWNTNLPYTVSARKIFNHIIHNKHDPSIPDSDVLKAITMIQDAVNEDKREHYKLVFRFKGDKPKHWQVGGNIYGNKAAAESAKKYFLTTKVKPHPVSIRVMTEQEIGVSARFDELVFEPLKAKFSMDL